MPGRFFWRTDVVCVRPCIHSQTILSSLEWYLTVPTHYVFLARFIKASIADQRMENMVNYLVELGVMHYDTMIMFSPSIVAASAIYAARSALLQTPILTNTLKHHTFLCIHFHHMGFVWV